LLNPLFKEIVNILLDSAGIIYFDNAATSWPKPREVKDAMAHFLGYIGANPGRSGHRMSIEASRILYRTRDALAELFHASNPLRVILCHNATEALNLALLGILSPGDHVVTSSMEHNSMMRPLRALEKTGVEITVVACSDQGFLDPDDVRKSIRGNTKLIGITHASNVVGTLLPVAEVGKIARDHGVILLVDAAQTAGAYPIDMEKDRIDLLAFSGHKSLYGPTGTGGLILGDRVDTARLDPLRRGGTGSRSEQETQPEFPPDKYESGTLNTVGFAGLNAGVRQILAQGVDSIRQYEMELTQRMIDGFLDMFSLFPSKRGQVYGGLRAEDQIAAISFNIHGIDPSKACQILDEEYGILCRTGLHCAPSAHRTIRTFPNGTIRFGLGRFNMREQVDFALNAVREL